MAFSTYSSACVWDPEKKEFNKGLIFSSKDEMKRAMQAYSIKNHHRFKTKESNQTVFKLKSKLDEIKCPWKLRSMLKRRENVWTITKYVDERTCTYPNIDQNHPQLDAKFIAY